MSRKPLHSSTIYSHGLERTSIKENFVFKLTGLTRMTCIVDKRCHYLRYMPALQIIFLKLVRQSPHLQQWLHHRNCKRHTLYRLKVCMPWRYTHYLQYLYRILIKIKTLEFLSYQLHKMNMENTLCLCYHCIAS